MTTSKLQGQAVARAELTDQDTRAMFALFDEHYLGVTVQSFHRDLKNKQWVLLLRDPDTRCVQGFSTLAVYETVVQDRPIGVLFSGDTIIRPAFWGTPELPRVWLRTALALSATVAQPLYWFLIASGYKTYRFLPIFAKEFYPCYDRPTPPQMQALMSHLARERFGPEYDPDTGIVRFASGATPLREGVAGITPERLRDPHICFFTTRNPGHAQGDELVCLARFHPDNFTAAARRLAA